MTENNIFNIEDSSNHENRKNRTGKLILAVLLLLTVALVFMFINSGINARNAGPAVSTGDGFSSAVAGGCCSSESPRFEDEESLAQGALDYYRKNGGDTTGLKAVVEDFGCHQEISLIREGELLKRYSYLDSEFFDLTP